MTTAERAEQAWVDTLDLTEVQIEIRRLIRFRDHAWLTELEESTYRVLCHREAAMLAGLRRLTAAMAAG